MTFTLTLGWHVVGTIFFSSGALVCSIIFLFHSTILLTESGYLPFMEKYLAVVKNVGGNRDLSGRGSEKTASKQDIDTDVMPSTTDLESEMTPATPKASKMNPKLKSVGSTSRLAAQSNSNISTSGGNAKRKIKDRGLAYKLASILTLLSFLFYALHGWCGTVSKIAGYQRSFMPVSCDIICQLGIGTYQLGKLFMYLVLIVRLQMAYGESAYRYPQWLLITLFCITALYCGTVMVYSAVFTVGDSIWISKDDRQYWLCNAIVADSAVLPYVAFDLIYSVVCLVLFIRPLHKLIKGMGGTTNISTSTAVKKLRDLSSKYAIVTFVAVTTSFASLAIMGIIDSGALSMLDVSINVVCLLLMSAVYDHYYEKICCGCIGMVSAMDKCYDAKKTVQGMARSVRKGSTGSKVSSPRSWEGDNIDSQL